MHLRIGIVGSGNVATHLVAAITQSDHQLKQVLSRDIKKAQNLTQNTDAQAIDKIYQIKDIDVIILAIKDEALTEPYINQFPKDLIICHSSGSVSMEVLKSHPQHGIFYPLQTFSKQTKVDFSSIPICLEASSNEVLQKLHQLASGISNKVYEINTEQRKALHLAAVFACNFANLMYDISEKLCRESDMDFDILRPLIQETATKIQGHLPSEVQTGPAMRNDQKTIQKHLDSLRKHPDYQNIYKILTDEIIQNNEKL